MSNISAVLKEECINSIRRFTLDGYVLRNMGPVTIGKNMKSKVNPGDIPWYRYKKPLIFDSRSKI